MPHVGEVGWIARHTADTAVAQVESDNATSRDFAHTPVEGGYDGYAIPVRTRNGF